jgi:hypothetical protein
MCVVTAYAGGLWELLRLITYLNIRGTSAHIPNRCVDGCTRSKSTRPNLCFEVSKMAEQLMTVTQQPVECVGIVVNQL